MGARVVSFHYTLKNKTGEVLDSSQGADPMTYLEGMGQIIPGLEESLKALSAGDKKNIEVKAADAYGEHDAALVMQIPKDRFPGDRQIEVGDQFQAGPNPDESPVFTVVNVTDSHINVDGNHPLAGQDLFFDVEVTEIRAATAEELEHGHAHGADGHHHH